MVVDYPDSLPAVKDLAACLRHTSLQVRRGGLHATVRCGAVPRRASKGAHARTALLNQAYKPELQTLNSEGACVLSHHRLAEP